MFTATINDLDIAYHHIGDGPPLVLLHGFSIDSRVWRPQLENLSDQFTVIAWDAPGAGQSDDPPETFTSATWADSLAGLLDAAEIQRAHIVGLSWGGILAQVFYGRHPQRVVSLVLADTYAGWKGSLPAEMVEERLRNCLQDAALSPAEFVTRYLPGMFSAAPPPAVQQEFAQIMSEFHPIGFRLMALSSAETDTRAILPSIRVPTLLIWGDADRRAPLALAYPLRDAIPGARLEIIPGAGHVSNLEQPERFNAIVRDFVVSIPPA